MPRARDREAAAQAPGNERRARRIFVYALALACIGGAILAVIILA
jgi:hypothetical protein